MDKYQITRRAFLTAATTTAAALTGCATKPSKARVVPGKVSPMEKVNVAGIGVGGKGADDLNQLSNLGANIVALCDVDERSTMRASEKFPNARCFKDYRVMLEQMPEIDAVTVSTPDHTHAPAAYMAMSLGKHVYVQKPLTHTVAEARLLLDTARKAGVATQMGNQGHSGAGVRELCEMIWSGAIGPVHTVHAWTNRPSWPQGIPDPLPEQEVREGLDWDLWIGTDPMRPYNEGYCPGRWRGWWDFGAGALGDMACHIMDPVFWGLKLTEAAEYTVEVVKEEGANTQTFPKSSVLKYSFPARGDMAAVDVYWYDGGNLPPWPEGVPEDQRLGSGRTLDRSNGTYFVGDDGMITVGCYGGNPRLIPDERMADYKMPKPSLKRIAFSHYANWLEACTGGDPACSNFEYSAPFTEMVLFGNLAIRAGKQLHWDSQQGTITNVDDPEALLSKPYRAGWELPV